MYRKKMKGKKTMIKSELIQEIALKNDLTRTDSDKLVNTIFNTIARALRNGGRVELRGFGVFSCRTRRERVARNPKTGQKVMVKEKRVPFFKAGKHMSESINK